MAIEKGPNETDKEMENRFLSSLNRIEILLLTISLLVVIIYFDSVRHSSPGFFID